jgi:CheY-like chemotaxis protein
MKIIVAEDDPLSREIIVQILKGLGHEVRDFENGGEALTAFNEEAADLIFSDWVMPGLDGLEFCRRIRQIESKNYVYFILATGGRTGDTDHDAAVRAGVDDFLIKPIHPDEIWRRLFVAKRILEFNRHIQQIRALLPACMFCKKMRDDNDYWQNFETYIQERPSEDSTIYVCPECQQTQADRAKRGA